MATIGSARLPTRERMKQLNRFFAWLEARSVWQIGLSYLVGAWVILQVVVDLSEVAGLPPWIGQLVLAALVAGLAGVLATAIAQRSSRLRRGRAPSASRLRLPRILTWRNLLTGA